MTETFGAILRRHREAAGLSLRALGGRLGGLSVPYLHDVEHGRRRMVPARWRALCDALPGLTVRALAEAALRAGPVELDASALTDEQRARLVEALEHAAA